MANYYEYEDLRKKALSADATQEDINELGEWFENYGSRYWDGESFDCDDDIYLYPVQLFKGDDVEVIGYTFSSNEEDRMIVEEEEPEEVELEELNTITRTFSAGDGFFVDITETLDWLGNGMVRQAWLYHESNGIKEMVFGKLLKDMSFDEFYEILCGTLSDDIESYRETYMDSPEVYEIVYGKARC